MTGPERAGQIQGVDGRAGEPEAAGQPQGADAAGTVPAAVAAEAQRVVLFRDGGEWCAAFAGEVAEQISALAGARPVMRLPFPAGTDPGTVRGVLEALNPRTEFGFAYAARLDAGGGR